MSGGSIIHFGVVRIRVTGNGNLECQFQGFDDVLTQNLVDIAMTYPDSRIKTRLSNFQSQAGKLRVGSDTINHVGRINDISIFAKPMWTDYPG